MTMTSRVDKSSDVEEVRSAFKASQQLQEGIDKKEQSLKKVTAEKVKLLDARNNKSKN